MRTWLRTMRWLLPIYLVQLLYAVGLESAGEWVGEKSGLKQRLRQLLWQHETRPRQAVEGGAAQLEPCGD